MEVLTRQRLADDPKAALRPDIVQGKGRSPALIKVCVGPDVVQVFAGALIRQHLLGRSGGESDMVARFNSLLKPLSVLALLLTVVLLFSFQGQVIVSQPLLIALIAVPIVIQSYSIFFITYAAAWAWQVPYPIAAPCALIGTSNFFELAVAVAIGLSCWAAARR